MPIWLRKFHISKINDWLAKQREEAEKVKKQNSPSSGKPQGPNINPSSTYNFKK